MTHQPPIPEAATSPYPLHPEPLAVESRAADATGRSARSSGGGRAPGLLMGATALVVTLLRRSRHSADASSGRAPAKGGDDKAKRGRSDRSRVAADQPYEVTYFARKHGISAASAREIIKQAGPDRRKANALAEERGEGRGRAARA